VGFGSSPLLLQLLKTFRLAAVLLHLIFESIFSFFDLPRPIVILGALALILSHKFSYVLHVRSVFLILFGLFYTLGLLLIFLDLSDLMLTPFDVVRSGPVFSDFLQLRHWSPSLKLNLLRSRRPIGQ
jgi:hypothetical protein